MPKTPDVFQLLVGQTSNLFQVEVRGERFNAGGRGGCGLPGGLRGLRSMIKGL
jgi:hypothetical protein